MKKLALIYWPKGGSVEYVTSVFKEKIKNYRLSVICVSDLKPTHLLDFDAFIFGGSTVGTDHWSNSDTENHWTAFFLELEKEQIKLMGKKVALFGLGNQVLYPDHFVDGMLYLKKCLETTQVQFIGETSTEGYDFTSSEAVRDDKFIGLVLDEDIQPELSNGRIEHWLEQILPMF